mmetsp:Transcript_8165/g.9367  ORF Transcript_8165/g.9367 Transcript_8165/m.9367 type:complete len:502 (-) Transcript_8165:943-2448(-)|eukprot:CAMPEP_0184023158 /NCGR_PEP_ID=MMETSP0954-20121128/11156_1 /TAXON_ID=627963 /ORGANISM="Aplanochytrium sp, Strain PBS07" /LENGTH=501 /DNA_ID=CAMNT_0026305913 /DNA_START=56 /DNA_END=1564 /DNA_ORIENTATION=+
MATKKAISLLPKSWGLPARSWINGNFIASRSSASTMENTYAATGETLFSFEVAEEAEVNQAVEVAKKAQKEWAEWTPIERGRVLRKAAEILERDNDFLAHLEAIDTSRPYQETEVVDIVSAKDCFEYYGSIAATIGGEYTQMPGGSFAYTIREPLGVCAGIGAWNYPIQGMAWKVAPALACGNAIIFKPSEVTPMTALALGEVLKEAGLPDGLLNVVLGGRETGQLLTRHEDIAKISFTGDVRTGRAICKDASATLKKVTMELGGKSPLIIFDDADIDDAVSGALLANFYSCGEVCSNGTRVFVQNSIKEKFIEKFVERTNKISIGDPLLPETQMGALINEGHLQKVLGYVEIGKQEGANLLCGGDRVQLDSDFSKGAFMSPAIFTDCNDDMRIVKEEIFGPVACVLGFDTEEEVMERANDTELGLAAGVFTKDITRAHRVIKNFQAGCTWINNYNLAPVELPWGGNKQSGIGRENGTAGIENWSQLKSVYVEMGKIECPY